MIKKYNAMVPKKQRNKLSRQLSTFMTDVKPQYFDILSKKSKSKFFMFCKLKIQNH